MVGVAAFAILTWQLSGKGDMLGWFCKWRGPLKEATFLKIKFSFPNLSHVAA